MDKRGYLLQPRSAEITRQRAANVDTLFPSSQPSFYDRLKTRVSSLWNYLFTPASEPRPSPHKRPNSEVLEEPKRFKPLTTNRFSLASSSQEGEEEPKPAPPEKKYFTPVLTRSHLRALARPKEETKVLTVAPANPKLQKSPPALDRDFEVKVIREEFERQTQAILDKRVLEVVPIKSKTPTPRRDDLGTKVHPVKFPQAAAVAKKPSPDIPKLPDSHEAVPAPFAEPPKLTLSSISAESPPKPLTAIDSKPPDPTKAVADSSPPIAPDTQAKSLIDKPPQPQVEAKDQPAAVQLPTVPEKPNAVPSQPVGFFTKAEEFKTVEPESPGFVVSESSQEEVSELSPIKDFCVKPEVPPPPNPLPPNPFQSNLAPPSTLPANPFAGPPPPNNPFLMPAAAPSTSVFVFGSSQPSHAAPPPVLNQLATPNPFLNAPNPPVRVQAPMWQPSEDAEMRAETPRAPFAPLQSQPTSLTYQPFGTFQTSLASQPPPQPNAGTGSFSIGQVGNRRIYRAKRPGQ